MASEGHCAYIAVDCEFSRDVNEVDRLGFEINEFSSYFREHKINNVLLKKYNKYNLNATLLSDFERESVYKMGRKREGFYYQRLISALLSFFESIFIKNKIDAVVFENVSNTFSHIAMYVCKEMKIKYCGYGSSRLPGRYSITNDPLTDHEDIKIHFNRIRNKETLVKDEIREWSKEYISNIESITPDYMKFNKLENTKLLQKFLKREKIKTLICALKHLFDDHYHSYAVGNPVKHLWQSAKRNISRRLKLSRIRKYYSSESSAANFLLYPLHFHPEASTSILAGNYLNELEVIRNIAFNLPLGVELWVKDHMSAFGYPELEFYEAITSYPNVKLIKPTAPTKQLIKRSSGIITLTSTVGYEALLLNKRVYLFGHVFYKFHQNVVIIKNPIEIFEVLTENIKRDPINDIDYNIDFISAYYMSTRSGLLNLMADKEAAKYFVEKNYKDLCVFT